MIETEQRLINNLEVESIMFYFFCEYKGQDQFMADTIYKLEDEVRVDSMNYMLLSYRELT